MTPSPDTDSPPVTPGPRKKPSGSGSGSSSGQTTKTQVKSSSAPVKVKSDAKVTGPTSPSKTSKTDLSMRPQLPTPVKETISPTHATPTGNAPRIVKNVQEHPSSREGSELRETPTTISSKKPGPQDYRSADRMKTRDKFGSLPKEKSSPLIEDSVPLFKDSSSSQSELCPADLVEYETLDVATVNLTLNEKKVAKPSSGSSWKGLDDKVSKPSSGGKELDEKVSKPSSGWKGHDEKVAKPSSGGKGLDEKVSKPAISPGSWKSVEDIPVNLNVRSLTVDELSRCLELLKMGRVAELFRQRMVDGCLLLDLTNESLKDEFGMTLFDATKLMKFARDGWRPKTQ